MKHFLNKWARWEFWPWWLANIPVYGFYAFFALRARHLFFFSNVNPAIPLGGAAGESKWDILQLLPTRIVPLTAFVPANSSHARIEQVLLEAGLEFPLIAKPDVGERGFLIKKVLDMDALIQHLEAHPADFLVQELLEHPLEATVLFHRFPDGRFGITSVCIKDFLKVTGDGHATVSMLMDRDIRSALQKQRFEKQDPELMQIVLHKGEIRELEPIGNHARGTKFLNGNHLINDSMIRHFESIVSETKGVMYGRFDLKCASEEGLEKGEVAVMELNGILGEPAHIYDPEYGMWRAYRDLYRHWRLLYRLHKAQLELNVRPTPHPEAIRFIMNYFRYKKQLEKPSGQ